LDGLHSARRGSYRILYRIQEELVVVTVIKIDHRKDVYRA
jgi:mRNA interferase RelE/StbE